MYKTIENLSDKVLVSSWWWSILWEQISIQSNFLNPGTCRLFRLDRTGGRSENLGGPIISMFIYWVSQLKRMRVTRRIVLTLLTKALYKFGSLKEKVWSFLKFWIWQRWSFTELPWDVFAWYGVNRIPISRNKLWRLQSDLQPLPMGCRFA